MYNLKFGCQSYPWKMGKHFGQLPRMLKVAAEAGFQSIECEIDMLGTWFHHGYEILEGMCLSALNNVRVDLPIQDLDYEPVFDRMRKDLPECDSRKMYIYDGKTPRKERD